MSKCHLLELPAELRNYIYELIFATQATTVDLTEASPSPRAITTACRQLHQETGPIYKAAYRSFWSTTKFTINVFEDLRSSPRIQPDGTEQVMGRVLDEDKKAKVYAKVQQLHEEDVAHVTKVHIFSKRTDRCWTLGVEEGGHDIWSLRCPIPLFAPNNRERRFYLPITKTEALEREQFEVLDTWRSKSYTALAVDRFAENDIAEARQIIARKGLTKEELMCFIRIVCKDMVKEHV